MNHDLVFLLEGLIAMASLAARVLSPLIPVWSYRVVGSLVPGILSAGYFVILFASPPRVAASRFAQVTRTPSGAPRSPTNPDRR